MSSQSDVVNPSIPSITQTTSPVPIQTTKSSLPQPLTLKSWDLFTCWEETTSPAQLSRFWERLWPRLPHQELSSTGRTVKVSAPEHSFQARNCALNSSKRVSKEDTLKSSQATVLWLYLKTGNQEFWEKTFSQKFKSQRTNQLSSNSILTDFNNKTPTDSTPWERFWTLIQ